MSVNINCEKIKTAQAHANMIWKRWTRGYLAQWNQRSKWTYLKSERRRTRSLCKTLWVQEETDRWNHYWQRPCYAITESHSDTWRAEPVSCKVSASILRWYFREQKKRLAMLAPHEISNQSHQKCLLKLKNLDFVRTLKMVKIDKFYHFGSKICVLTPDFGKGKLEKPEVTEHGSGNLLFFPGSNKHYGIKLASAAISAKLANSAKYGSKLAFFDILSFIVKNI